MKIKTLTRFIGDEDPIQIWWEGFDGNLINFASGYTFSSTLAYTSDPRTAIFTKTTGFTGAAVSGTELSGTPNLTVAWATSGELNTSSLTEGEYQFTIVATKTSDSSQTTMRVRLTLKVR